MDFLRDILQIQNELILDQVSTKLLNNDFEKHTFIEKYNKTNYCLVKISNCNIRKSCVKIDDLISKLECDHNPSLSR